MVGDPKELSDLRKIEATVRISCRACRHEEDWTIEELGRLKRRTRTSTVWSLITDGMRCPVRTCRSTDLYPLPIPYGARPLDGPPVKLRDLFGRWVWVAIRCGCGYTSQWPAEMLAKRVGADAVVTDLLKRARCTVCGGRATAVQAQERLPGQGDDPPTWRLVPGTRVVRTRSG